ncbi:hypothetical protein B566_EDAN006784 [Ephemera danica]|nr:hypothetical protein B566_EDAN006784 [Ephemera danica]
MSYKRGAYKDDLQLLQAVVHTFCHLALLKLSGKIQDTTTILPKVKATAVCLRLRAHDSWPGGGRKKEVRVVRGARATASAASVFSASHQNYQKAVACVPVQRYTYPQRSLEPASSARSATVPVASSFRFAPPELLHRVILSSLKSQPSDFDGKLKEAGSKLVVVDFFATWCGPCKMIAPQMETLSKECPNVVFLKVDVDECEELAAEYSITAMPTFLFFKNKKTVETMTGANYDKLKALVTTHQ